SIVYRYAGDYLKDSFTLKGKHESALQNDEIQSYTKYDETAEQKLLFTYNFKGGVKLGSTIDSFAASDVSTSVVYRYAGDYLKCSFTLKGKKETAAQGDEIQ